MKAIAAVDANWGIGFKGKLLARIPEDQKFFRDTTLGSVVVMGRQTLESLPGGRVLDGRANVVLTHDPDFHRKDVVAVHSIEELQKLQAANADKEFFCIGGGQVYAQLLPYCDEAYITKIAYSYEADTYFPNLDEQEDWELVETSEEKTCFDMEYYFTRYHRIRKES